MREYTFGFVFGMIAGVIMGAGLYSVYHTCPDDPKSDTHSAAPVETQTKATHFRCWECGKWDYVKNLEQYDSDVYLKLRGGYLHIDEQFCTFIGSTYVHPECSQIKPCDCMHGWRLKETDAAPTKETN